MIPYGRQDISQQDIDAVVSSLTSDWLTQGPSVPHFESAMAEYCQAQHAVAVNSATSALHLACLVLGVQKGDIVWTSPNSFVASANCALYCNADVDFVDISLTTGNLCVDALKIKLEAAKKAGKLPKVVIPVHFAGQSCDMERIAKLATEYDFKVIEDASHAVGARYQNKPVGNCEYSDICVFSFHPVKIITTMEGGMALTNDAELALQMKQLRSHGINIDPQAQVHESHGPWYYEQHSLGYNYRMNDVEAALGLSQLKRLDDFVIARNKLAALYAQKLAYVSGVTPLRVEDDAYSAYHLYVVRVHDMSADEHRNLVVTLREQGVFAHVHYIPIYKQPFYKQRYPGNHDYPNAERYYREAVTLPLYPNLSPSDITFVTDKLIAALP